MTDIRLDTRFQSHPKTKLLRRRLGADGVLSLLALWCFAADERQDGVLVNMDADYIAIATDWAGDPQEFVDTLLSIRFLENINGVLTLHNWEERNPWVAGAQKRSDAAKVGAKAKWEKRNADLMRQSSGADAVSCEPHETAENKKNSRSSKSTELSNDAALCDPHAVSCDPHADSSGIDAPSPSPSPSPYPSPNPPPPTGESEGVGVEAVQKRMTELFGAETAVKLMNPPEPKPSTKDEYDEVEWICTYFKIRSMNQIMPGTPQFRDFQKFRSYPADQRKLAREQAELHARSNAMAYALMVLDGRMAPKDEQGRPIQAVTPPPAQYPILEWSEAIAKLNERYRVFNHAKLPAFLVEQSEFRLGRALTPHEKEAHGAVYEWVNELKLKKSYNPEVCAQIDALLRDLMREGQYERSVVKTTLMRVFNHAAG